MDGGPRCTEVWVLGCRMRCSAHCPAAAAPNPLTDTIHGHFSHTNLQLYGILSTLPPSLASPAAVNHQPTQTRLHHRLHRLHQLSALIGVLSLPVCRVPPFHSLLTVLITTGPTPSIINPSFLFPSALLLHYFKGPSPALDQISHPRSGYEK